jgi:hypothetical protein
VAEEACRKGNKKRPWLQSKVLLNAQTRISLREGALDIDLVPAGKTATLDIKMGARASAKYAAKSASSPQNALLKKLASVHRAKDSMSAHQASKGVYERVKQLIAKEEGVTARALENTLAKSRTIQIKDSKTTAESANGDAANPIDTLPPTRSIHMFGGAKMVESGSRKRSTKKNRVMPMSVLKGGGGGAKGNKKTQAVDERAPEMNEVLAGSQAGVQAVGAGISAGAGTAGGMNGLIPLQNTNAGAGAAGEQLGNQTMEAGGGLAGGGSMLGITKAKTLAAGKKGFGKQKHSRELSCFTEGEKAELRKEKRRMAALHQSEKLIRGEFGDLGLDDAGDLGLEVDFLDQWVAVADGLKDALFGATGSVGGFLKDEHPLGVRRLDEWRKQTMPTALSDLLVNDGSRVCAVQNLDPKLSRQNLVSVGDLAALNSCSYLGDSQATVRLLPGGGRWSTPLVDAHNPQKLFTLRLLRRMCSAYNNNGAAYGIGIGEHAELILDLNTKIATVYGTAQEGGTVLLLDISHAQVQQGATFSVSGALFHTLTHGDTLNMETGAIAIADWKQENVADSFDEAFDQPGQEEEEAEEVSQPRVMMGRRASVTGVGQQVKEERSGRRSAPAAYQMENAALSLFGSSKKEHVVLKTDPNEELQYVIVLSAEAEGAEGQAGWEEAQKTSAEDGDVEEGGAKGPVFSSFKGVTLSVLPSERRITILAGPPGCGKSTHGPSIAKEVGTPYVTMGEIILAAVEAAESRREWRWVGDWGEKGKGVGRWESALSTHPVAQPPKKAPGPPKKTAGPPKPQTNGGSSVAPSVKTATVEITEGFGRKEKHFKGPVEREYLMEAKQVMLEGGMVDSKVVKGILDYELHWGAFKEAARRTRRHYIRWKQDEKIKRETVTALPSLEDANADSVVGAEAGTVEGANATGGKVMAGEAMDKAVAQQNPSSISPTAFQGAGNTLGPAAPSSALEQSKHPQLKDPAGLEAAITAAHAASLSAAAALFAHRIAREEWQNGYVLDGYPRTVEQAQDLDNMLRANKEHVWKVVGNTSITRLAITHCNVATHLRLYPLYYLCKVIYCVLL